MSGRLSMCAKLSDESCGGIHFSELLHPQCAKNDPVLAIDGNGPMMVVAHTKRLNLFGFDEHHGWNLKVNFLSSDITLNKFILRSTRPFKAFLRCQNYFFWGHYLKINWIFILRQRKWFQAVLTVFLLNLMLRKRLEMFVIFHTLIKPQSNCSKLSMIVWSKWKVSVS